MNGHHACLSVWRLWLEDDIALCILVVRIALGVDNLQTEGSHDAGRVVTSAGGHQQWVTLGASHIQEATDQATTQTLTTYIGVHTEYIQVQCLG